MLQSTSPSREVLRALHPLYEHLLMLCLAETFEVDLWARNDLAVPVILSDISIVFDGSGRDCLPQDLISEVVKEHTLAPSITTKVRGHVADDSNNRS